MKRINVALLLSVLTLGCIREREGFDAGGPIERHLIGRWQLERVVAPSGMKTGSQIGYTEIIENGNDNVDDFEKTFRDGSLVSTYTRLRSPASIADAKDMTMTLFYWGNKQRFYKIRRDATRSTLEASGYVAQVGSPADSVRYFYYQLR